MTWRFDSATSPQAHFFQGFDQTRFSACLEHLTSISVIQGFVAEMSQEGQKRPRQL